jgi:hypothetical protein
VPSGHEIRLLKLLCSECSLCDRLWLKRLFSFVDELFMSCMGLSGHYNIPAYLSRKGPGICSMGLATGTCVGF